MKDSYYTDKVYKDTEAESLRFTYNAISAFKEVSDISKWDRCKDCNAIPLVWEFDNGRKTACKCGRNEYDHLSVTAKDIMTVMRESDNGQSMVDYDSDLLRKNWNKAQRNNHPTLTD